MTNQGYFAYLDVVQQIFGAPPRMPFAEWDRYYATLPESERRIIGQLRQTLLALDEALAPIDAPETQERAIRGVRHVVNIYLAADAADALPLHRQQRLIPALVVALCAGEDVAEIAEVDDAFRAFAPGSAQQLLDEIAENPCDERGLTTLRRVVPSRCAARF